MKKLDTLTDKLSQKTSVTQFKKDATRIPNSVREVITLIRLHQFSWSDWHHVKKLNKAIELGYVDEELNILKEV